MAKTEKNEDGTWKHLALQTEHILSRLIIAR
jgi:hypothetical protein